jgi:hypothetical protein
MENKPHILMRKHRTYSHTFRRLPRSSAFRILAFLFLYGSHYTLYPYMHISKLL